jgi:hypothetical protein
MGGFTGIEGSLTGSCADASNAATNASAVFLSVISKFAKILDVAIVTPP